MEVHANRKALAVLHDVISRILNSARDLSALIDSLIKGDVKDIKICLNKMKNSEEVVENLRIILTREVAEIGSLTVYREGVLRTTYIMDEIGTYIRSISVRLLDINISVLRRADFDLDLKDQISMTVEMIFKICRMGRAVSRPLSIMELAEQVQKVEGRVDTHYRTVTLKAVDEIGIGKDLLLLKDSMDCIEAMSNKCHEGSDSLTILALSM
ncbi:MAG: DUF47 domain-containing protein [Nitrososphaeraceae archaeon]